MLLLKVKINLFNIIKINLIQFKINKININK